MTLSVLSAGVEIASHVNGTSIGDPRFEPFFAAPVAFSVNVEEVPVVEVGLNVPFTPAGKPETLKL